ncbi:MAG: hypothetical protein H6710_02235 [Myxococcales bacterium]|nr:hypothetical protein [Myxococcales bacterium]
MVEVGREGVEELDLRPWAAGVDPSLVVDLLWPLSFQTEEAAPWVGDILERATMAERRLPVLAEWARRWRVIQGDARGELPMVHARWAHDAEAGAGSGRGGERTPSTPPVVSARRAPATATTPSRAPASRAAPARERSEAAATPARGSERGGGEIVVEHVHRVEVSAPRPDAVGEAARGEAPAAIVAGRVAASVDDAARPLTHAAPSGLTKDVHSDMSDRSSVELVESGGAAPARAEARATTAEAGEAARPGAVAPALTARASVRGEPAVADVPLIHDEALARVTPAATAATAATASTLRARTRPRIHRSPRPVRARRRRAPRSPAGPRSAPTRAQRSSITRPRGRACAP